MRDPLPLPTPEMVSHFEKRTLLHIEMVGEGLETLIKAIGYKEELRVRAAAHDQSKFEPEEKIPYIWLTEFHRQKSLGNQFAYPDHVEAAVKAAIKHHYSNNRHHPEFHESPNEMTDIDLAEMVCDWNAVAREKGEAGYCLGWAQSVVGSKYKFNKNNSNQIFKLIEILNSNYKNYSPRH